MMMMMMLLMMITITTIITIRAVIAQSVWRWATGWTIGVLGFDSRRGLGIFSSPPRPGRPWDPPSLLSNGYLGGGGLSLGVKRPGREADHSPPSSAQVKEWVKLYLYFPNTPSWRGAQLKHRDNFILYLYNNSYTQHNNHKEQTGTGPSKCLYCDHLFASSVQHNI
jgi:hypothetical protein